MKRFPAVSLVLLALTSFPCSPRLIFAEPDPPPAVIDMSSESMVPAPATLHEIFAASVICGPAQSFGAGSVYGQSERVLYEIKGGEVTGEINGKVL